MRTRRGGDWTATREGPVSRVANSTALAASAKDRLGFIDAYSSKANKVMPDDEKGTGDPIGAPPPNAVTIEGEPITIDGEYLTIGEAMPVADGGELIEVEGRPTPPEGQVFVTDKDGAYVTDKNGAYLTVSRETSAATSDGTQATSGLDASSFKASSWTGRRSNAEQTVVILRVAPIAIEGIEALIANIEAARPNDEQSLRDLRQLHAALGELIEAADRGFDLRTAMLSVWNPMKRALDWSDSAFSAVTRSPTMTLGVLASLGYVFDVDLTTAIFSGVVSGYIKNPQAKP